MSSSDTKYLIYDKDEIAKRLKEQRKLTGHSQAQLAKKIDALIGKAANQNGLCMDKHAGVEYVSGWENNTRAITLNVLMAYSKIYNVTTFMYLFYNFVCMFGGYSSYTIKCENKNW